MVLLEVNYGLCMQNLKIILVDYIMTIVVCLFTEI